MYRKIVIAVDCASDEERDEVQRVVNELSQMRLFEASRILKAYPYFRQHQRELTRLFEMVSKGGVKSLMSGSALSLIAALTKR
jgi:hypothetical protein